MKYLSLQITQESVHSVFKLTIRTFIQLNAQRINDRIMPYFLITYAWIEGAMFDVHRRCVRDIRKHLVFLNQQVRGLELFKPRSWLWFSSFMIKRLSQRQMKIFGRKANYKKAFDVNFVVAYEHAVND